MDVVEQAFIFSQEIAAETEIADVLDAVVDRTRRLIRTAEVRLCLGPGSEGAVELTIAPPVDKRGNDSAWIIAENRPNILPTDQDCADCTYAQSHSHLHFMLAPLTTGARDFGGLCVFRDEAKPFTPREIKAFELMAGSAAAAIAGAVEINHAGRHAAAELHRLLTRSLGHVQEQIEAVRRQASLADDQLMVELVRLRAGLNRAQQQVEAAYRRSRSAHENGPDLTRREMQVLELIATGATNREISERLVISVHTTKSHVRSILYKFNAVNRRHAASLAVRMGLVKPQED